MGLIKKHWLGSKVTFTKENNTLKILMTSKYLLENDFRIPQWFILAPLFFLIYVNDFHLASKLKNVMFADDTNLFISDENIGELFQKMNKELKSGSTWFKANKLSINIDKTK